MNVVVWSIGVDFGFLRKHFISAASLLRQSPKKALKRQQNRFCTACAVGGLLLGGNNQVCVINEGGGC